jgi:hypothetical protein
MANQIVRSGTAIAFEKQQNVRSRQNAKRAKSRGSPGPALFHASNRSSASFLDRPRGEIEILSAYSVVSGKADRSALGNPYAIIDDAVVHCRLRPAVVRVQLPCGVSVARSERHKDFFRRTRILAAENPEGKRGIAVQSA